MCVEMCKECTQSPCPKHEKVKRVKEETTDKWKNFASKNRFELLGDDIALVQEVQEEKVEKEEEKFEKEEEKFELALAVTEFNAFLSGDGFTVVGKSNLSKDERANKN